MAKKGQYEVSMRMRLIVLVIAAAVMALGSLAGCSETPSVRVVETVRVTDSPQTLSSPVIRVVETIGVTDSPQMLLSIMIRVAESIAVSDSPTLTPQQPLPPPTKVTITVTSPKAEAVWRVGTAQNIGWTTTGEGIAYVDIYYSTDGGKSMISIARKEPNDGIYTWKMPNTPSKTVLVRVLAFNVKGETLALGDSGLFTISIQ